MKEKKPLLRCKSKRGWFFFQVGGDIYAWMLELGPLGISWEWRRR